MGEPKIKAAEREFDGRRLRSKTSQGKIIDAMLRLNETGNMAPTAQEIAKESGVSLRSLFRLFEDMETLFAEANRKLYEQFEPVLLRPIEGVSLEDRLYHCTLRRLELFEAAGPYIRGTKSQMWKFPVLDENYQRLVRNLRADLLRWLPELKDCSKATQMSVETLTSFETWDRMRRYTGESQKQSAEAIYQSCLRLIQSE